MGLLDNVIGSVTGSGKEGGKEGGGTSPLTKALLLLLAAKMATSYFGKSGAPAGDAHAGAAPPPAPSGKIESGILAGLPSLGSIFGGGSSPQEAPSAAPASGGKIESGILAGFPSLDSILGSLRSSGHGDKVDSWIGEGDNKEVPPQDLGKAIGPEVLEQLSKATGIPKDTLLHQLSGALPQVVDKLTPDGTLPDPQNRSHW